MKINDPSLLVDQEIGTLDIGPVKNPMLHFRKFGCQPGLFQIHGLYYPSANHHQPLYQI